MELQKGSTLVATNEKIEMIPKTIEIITPDYEDFYDDPDWMHDDGVLDYD